MTKVTLFRSFYEASLNGDWDVAAGMLDDDCEYVMMPTMAVSKGSSCTRLTPGACSAIILLQLVHLSDPCAVLDEAEQRSRCVALLTVPLPEGSHITFAKAPPNVALPARSTALLSPVCGMDVGPY